MYCCFLAIPTNNIENKSKTNTIELFLLLGLYGSLLLTGILPQTIISMAVVILSTLLVFRDKPHYVFPAMLFYYSQLGILFGMSVFRIFTIIFIFVLLVKHYQKIVFNNKYLLVLIVYFLYCFLALANYNLQKGIFAFFDVICLLVLSENFIQSENNVKSFFTHYIIVALLAYVTGVITNNIMDTTQEIGTQRINMMRYMATFNDPNYMGLFYTIAIFALVCLKLFNKPLRIILIIAFYAMIFSTLSVTAIIGNIVFWLIYLLIDKKVKLKYLFAIIIALFFGVAIYNYSLQNEIPLITNLSLRINSKLEQLLVGDIDEFTTGRTAITINHLEYFISQNPFKILFGGNLVNNVVIDLPNSTGTAHNEYVDLLLNVGLIGAIILIAYPIIALVKSIVAYERNRNRKDLMIVLLKTIWLYYAATLTLFLDARFTLFYLI